MLEVAQIDAARVDFSRSSVMRYTFGRCGSGGGMLSAAVHASSYGSEVDASAHCCTNRSNGRVRLARSIASASDVTAALPPPPPLGAPPLSAPAAGTARAELGELGGRGLALGALVLQ